jgi:hypothetical protein
MKLYHGTSSRFLERIKSKGLEPRNMHGTSNWKHTVQSNGNFVYLTNAYALTFAINSLTDAHKELACIIEMDTDFLNFFELCPDEDALEQTSRKQDALPEKWDMKRRTVWYRNRLRQYGGQWPASLKALGNCAHYGTISPSAFTRIALVDVLKNAPLAWTALDPTITLLNYELVGMKYRNLTRLIFGEKSEPLGDTHPLSHVNVGLQGLTRDGITILERKGNDGGTTKEADKWAITYPIDPPGKASVR